MTSNKLMYHVYLMLFPIAYISLLMETNYTMYLDVAIIVFSYYLILVKGQLEPILYLILFSRCINGFILPNSTLAYSFVNLTTSYLPIALVFVHGLTHVRMSRIGYTLFTKYKFTTIYLALLITYALVDIDLSVYCVTRTIVPIIFFLMWVLVVKHELCLDRILLFFRYVFVSILIGYFLLDYTTISRELLENAVVFKKPVGENQYFVLLQYFRNMGVFWDIRMLGIFSYVYLFVALVNRSRFRVIDIPLALVSIITSMSRGSIVVGALLLIPLLLSIDSRRWLRSIVQLRTGFKVAAIAGVMTIVGLSIAKLPIIDYVKSFSVLAENSALDQRAGFRDYALNAFWENPLGHGLGYLKSPAKHRSIEVGDEVYNTVSDAYLFIILGEIGFIGFVFFILSTLEILYYKTAYSIFLLVGYFGQLLGTDIPDMGVFYFVFLIIVSSASSIHREAIAAPYSSVAR